jgi:hypothetical protein
MKRARMLYAMVRADFLERVRRYSFLLTLGLAMYLGYMVYAGQVTLRLGEYRGVNNSAWIGSVIALVATVWLTLVGFYVVKNAIQRDRDTRVGQILATTPISKPFYTVAKALSNFAALGAMILILAGAAVAIELVQGSGQVDWFALLAPVLVFGLCGVAVAGSLAVLFESLPVLRGGVGNIAYFFVWVALLVLSAGELHFSFADAGKIGPFAYLSDLTGIAAITGQMQQQVHGLDASYQGGSSFTVGELSPGSKTFVWEGLRWNLAIVVSRLFWLAVSLGIAIVAAVFFDRFDPAKGMAKGSARGLVRARRAKKLGVVAPIPGELPPLRAEVRDSAAHLTQLVRGKVRTRFGAMVAAELRLMIRGLGWWWYAVAAAIVIGSVASPLEDSRSGWILAAWIWPTLLWSPMGTREAQYSTRTLIFSAPRAFPRQLLAVWGAGVLVAMLTGCGLAVRELLAGDWPGLYAWLAGALFIPSLALALGVWTESRKPFEGLYTAWWYLGPLHHIRTADFMGTTAQSSRAGLFVTLAVLLLMGACGWRRVRLAYA